MAGKCQRSTTVPPGGRGRRALQEVKIDGSRSLAWKGTAGESETEGMGIPEVPGSPGLRSSGSSVSETLAPARVRINMKSEMLVKLLLSRISKVSSPRTCSPVEPPCLIRPCGVGWKCRNVYIIFGQYIGPPTLDLGGHDAAPQDPYRWACKINISNVGKSNAET